MPLRLFVDRGGEKYVSFAKKRLADMKAWMLAQGVMSFSKHYFVASGDRIRVSSLLLPGAPALDTIQIRAQAQARIIVRTDTATFTIFNWLGTHIIERDVSDLFPAEDCQICAAVGPNIVVATGNNVLTAQYWVVDTNTWEIITGPLDVSVFAPFQSPGVSFNAPAFFSAYGTQAFAAWSNFSPDSGGHNGRATITDATLSGGSFVATTDPGDAELGATPDLRNFGNLLIAPHPQLDRLQILSPLTGGISTLAFPAGSTAGNVPIVATSTLLIRPVSIPAMVVEFYTHAGVLVASESVAPMTVWRGLVADDDNVLCVGNGAVLHFSLPDRVKTEVPSLAGLAANSVFFQSGGGATFVGAGLHVLTSGFGGD